LVALWIANFLVAGAEGAYPNPLWLPVLVLSLQYGLGVGIIAALSACALQYTIFAPAQGLTEDIYDYVARATAEPIVWTCVALLIGYIRHAQIRQRSQLQAELAERNNECVTVAELCENLKKRAEMLERHIAVNLPASHIDTAEAIAGLHSANWENFAERLTRFVNLMLGSSEFALYLLRGDILKLVFLPPDIDTPPTGSSISADDPVFEVVVRQRRMLKASGADVVGGIPWIEASAADAQVHIEFCFDLAAAFNADVSMLLDDVGDPDMKTLEAMAREAIAYGYQGRALAHHCRAMALYDETYFGELTPLLRQARISVVSDPHTGPLHARVRELLADSVNVCLGQDDISDAYYPFGRNNMMEVAFLAAHLLWMTRAQEMETLYEMITTRAAKAINLKGYGLEAGCAANLVVLDQPSVTEALRFHAPPAAVISHGRLVDLERMRQLAQPGR